MIPYRMNPLGISVNENIPLTLTAEQANSTITLNATGSPTVSGLHYRLGKSGLWLPYTIGTTITLANVGDCVQFWNSAGTLSTDNANRVTFSMTGQISGSGIIESLIDWETTVPDYAMNSLFYNLGSLVRSPDFSGVTLGRNCYAQILRQTGITAMPQISARTLGTASMASMFYRCYSLTGESVMQQSDPAQGCYQSAFQETAITSVVIGLESLAAYCLYGAFLGCSNLSRIEVNFTSWGNIATATQDWVSGVAAEGTFIKPAALPEEYGTNRIPTGWTVVNK